MSTTEEEGIQALSRAVMAEARAEAEHNLVEARQKAETIRSESRAQAAAERSRIMAHADQEAARLHSQAIASAQLKARTLLLEQREILLNAVFEQARKQIAGLEKSPDYKEIANSLLKEALEHLGSDSALIRADSTTRGYLTSAALEPVSKETGIKLELGEPLNQGTGVIVHTPDGHRQFDNTLETRLNRMQDELRNPVHRLLMGESL
jgi:V/A-type H+/Na+-transporting ATPase subunit E